MADFEPGAFSAGLAQRRGLQALSSIPEGQQQAHILSSSEASTCVAGSGTISSSNLGSSVASPPLASVLAPSQIRQVPPPPTPVADWGLGSPSHMFSKYLNVPISPGNPNRDLIEQYLGPHRGQFGAPGLQPTHHQHHHQQRQQYVSSRPPAYAPTTLSNFAVPFDPHHPSATPPTSPSTQPFPLPHSHKHQHSPFPQSFGSDSSVAVNVTPNSWDYQHPQQQRPCTAEMYTHYYEFYLASFVTVMNAAEASRAASMAANNALLTTSPGAAAPFITPLSSPAVSPATFLSHHHQQHQQQQHQIQLQGAVARAYSSPEIPAKHPSGPAATASDASPFVAVSLGFAFPKGLNRKDRRRIMFQENTNPCSYPGAVPVPEGWMQANGYGSVGGDARQPPAVKVGASTTGDDAAKPATDSHFVRKEAVSAIVAITPAEYGHLVDLHAAEDEQSSKSDATASDQGAPHEKGM